MPIAYGAHASRHRTKKDKGPVERDMGALYQDLLQQHGAAQGQDPSSTAFFQTGQGQIADFLRRTARGDAARTAQAGAGGSEMGIAQAGNRANVAAGQTRELLSGSEQMLDQKRRYLLAALMQALGMRADLGIAKAGIAAQKQGQWIAGISNIVSNILPGGGSKSAVPVTT